MDGALAESEVTGGGVAVGRASMFSSSPQPVESLVRLRLLFGETPRHHRSYFLKHGETQYTRFQDSLNTITMPHAGNVAAFEKSLKDRIRKGQVMGQPLPSETSPELEPLPEIFTEED